MTIHEYHLHDTPFKKISTGIKHVEARLNDEKRQQLHIGDKLRITNRTTGEVITATIADLVYQPSFTDLFEELTPQAMGHATIEIGIDELRQYYSVDEENALGVVGIVLQEVHVG